MCNLGGVRSNEWQVHGGDDAGRRPDPEDVLAREQGGDAEASGLVLPDDVVAAWKQGCLPNSTQSFTQIVFQTKIALI